MPAQGAEVKSLEYYDIIVQRSPFGVIATSNETVVAAETPGFATQYTFVGLVSTGGDEVAAIIHDTANNRTHFRTEGETINGATVIRIERSPSKVVLQQGAEVATLAYDEVQASSQPVAAPTTEKPESRSRRSRRLRRLPLRRGG